jgi:hypothetical protein
MPKSLGEEWLEMDKASGVVFPCLSERKTPYLLSIALIPFVCFCLDIWQWEEWEDVRVRTPPQGSCLRTLKRDLMEIMYQADSWQV